MEKCANKVSEKTSSGLFPLHLAANEGHIAVVKYLCSLEDSGLNTSSGDGSGTPLHHAVANGHFDIVKYLVEEKQCNLSIRNEQGLTPYMLAQMTGKPAIVEVLANHKPSSSSTRKPSSHDLHSQLNKFILDGRYEKVKEILKTGTNTTFETSFPLHVASSAGHMNIVQLLIQEFEYEADAPDATGMTPLHKASEKGHIEIIETLASMVIGGIDIPDSSGREIGRGQV